MISTSCRYLNTALVIVIFQWLVPEKKNVSRRQCVLGENIVLAKKTLADNKLRQSNTLVAH